MPEGKKLLSAIREGKPERAEKMIDELDDVARVKLLRHASRAPIARRIYEKLDKPSPKILDLVVPKGAVAVYEGRTSLRSLGEFQLQIFRDEKGGAWGRARVVNLPVPVNGYFQVRAEDELIFDFSETPPRGLVPKGWPRPKGPTSATSMAFRGIEYRLRATGRGILTGSVWRHGKDLGVSVTLIRKKQ
jgi:hypothetical protein